MGFIIIEQIIKPNKFIDEVETNRIKKMKE